MGRWLKGSKRKDLALDLGANITCWAQRCMPVILVPWGRERRIPGAHWSEANPAPT